MASISKKDAAGRIIGAYSWTPERITYMTGVLQRYALDGVGDPARQRCFRMNITLCLHRAVTEKEASRLPQWWWDEPPGEAGQPVQVLWSTGLPDIPSARPCDNPIRDEAFRNRPDLWIPVDCGKCLPCLARIELRRSNG